MMRRDIADRLQNVVYYRFKEEQPGRELTKDELENIWYVIYGKLCRGETEKDVEDFCRTVPLSKRKKDKILTSSLNDKISAAENRQKTFEPTTKKTEKVR